jgi:hypothetical protein
MGCLVLALGASLTTCRLDKLINPTIADRLAVSPGSLRDSAYHRSSALRTDTVLVATADGATLPWKATNDSAWLTLSPSSGGAPESVIVTLSPGTLPEGVYQDVIAFTSTQTNDTINVPVTFEILPPAPELSRSPASRADSAFVGSVLPDTFTLRIKNTGSLPFTWTAALDAGWITLSDSGGSVPAQDSTSTIVTLRPESLGVGTHRDTITITAPGAIPSTAAVPITYTIRPCAETGITPDVVVTDSVTLSDCGAPHRAGRQAKLYSVQAAPGDALSFRLTGFDTYLVLTDSIGTVLKQNDDCSTPGGPACILEYGITTAGRYVVEATTAAPGATGAFTLSAVKERAPSPPQSALQFRKDSATAIGVGALTPQDTVVFKATVNDPNPGDSVRLEIEVLQTVSTFLGNATDSSAFVSVASGARPVAVRVPPSGSPRLQDNARYHWQARTCDKTARCSAWLSFGQNADTAADFVVNAVEENPVLDSVSLNQYNGNSATPMPVGQGTGGGLGTTQTVTFKGMVTDPDPRDVIVLEVEVKATGTAFNGLSLFRGAGVTSSSIAAASFSDTVELLVTKSYHWRARACDQTGRCSAWASFGGNPEGDADFRVP